MIHRLLMSIFLTILIFTGCTTKPKIDVDTTPTMQIPKKVAPAVKKKGALYSRRGASLFADKKDLQMGDIIQVLIEETLTNDSTDERELKKANTTDIGAGVFSAPGSASSGTTNIVNKLNNGLLGVGFQTNSTNSFKGTSKSKADEEFTTSISAIIEQTYQNGNYFIKGSKEMLINGQKQNIRISGVIRPYDISPENTVYSYQLANLKILYEKDGTESDSTKQGWGTRLIESISPF